METGVEREQEPDRFAPAIDVATRLLNNIETVVYGKREEVKLVLAALMCGGHVLLEDVPGTAKTVLARAIGGSIDGVTISRIQCTPDLQPTDVTGMSVFDQKTRDFEFRPGPIFTNVLLVDEINRATPKTQSALLEAMAEGQVTVDGVTMVLPSPFFLLATDNPIEYEGTFPLPEAQLDRFLLRTALGYPGVLEERRILEEQRYRHPLGELRPAVSLADIRELRDAAQHVYVDEVLHNWIVDLVRATRELEVVSIGGSVRGSLAVERVARAWALLNGRGYVIPEDVERLFVPVLVHRVVFTPALVARARAAGWPAAIEEFRQACLELAPRPGSDEDPLFHERHRPDQGVSSGQQTFQLVPRRRLMGLPHGTMRSVRRGRGTEVAGSRPYRPGDDIRTIDWASSARLSSARGRGRIRRSRAVRGRGPARRRASATAARSWRSSGHRCPGSTRAPRCGEPSSSCSRAPRDPAASAATSTTRTASRSGCRRAGSGGSRMCEKSGSTRPAGVRRPTGSSGHWSTCSSIAGTSPREASSSSSPTSSNHRLARPGSLRRSTSGTSFRW